MSFFFQQMMLAITRTFPTIAATSHGNNSTTQTTSDVVSFPTGTVSGDMVLLTFSVENTTSITTPTNFTLLDAVRTYPSITGAIGIFYGTAVSGSATVSHGLGRASWAVLRITGYSGVPSISGPGSSAASTAPNSPSLTPGLTLPYLWLSIAGIEASGAQTYSFSAVPAFFTESVQETGVTTVSSSAIDVAYRQFSTATQNPAAFTSSPSASWVAWTLAITPA